MRLWLEPDQKHVHSLAKQLFPPLMISLYEIHSILRKEHQRTPCQEWKLLLFCQKSLIGNSPESWMTEPHIPYGVQSHNSRSAVPCPNSEWKLDRRSNRKYGVLLRPPSRIVRSSPVTTSTPVQLWSTKCSVDFYLRTRYRYLMTNRIHL